MVPEGEPAFRHSLSHILWDSNTAPVVGTVSETGHLDGPAAFDADGYHILAESEAVQRGVNVVAVKWRGRWARRGI